MHDRPLWSVFDQYEVDGTPLTEFEDIADDYVERIAATGEPTFLEFLGWLKQQPSMEHQAAWLEHDYMSNEMWSLIDELS